MPSWDEVRRWRKRQRASLIARRQAIPQDERRRLQPSILDLVERHFPELASALVGFYWPFRGEIGPHPLVHRLVERGARAALPVVVEKRQPLEFWAWHPGAPLRRGVWDIPIPAERHIVRPTALLVPLVGFDDAGYRLGYGGGYYDRTLAAMDPKPLTIGIGYELGRLPTIHPQRHDVPMDAVVTEAGLVKSPPWRPGMARDSKASRASPIWDEDPNAMSTSTAIGVVSNHRKQLGGLTTASLRQDIFGRQSFCPEIGPLEPGNPGGAGLGCGFLVRGAPKSA